MIDCIEAVAAPQLATAYIRPSASIFTVEGGRFVLHVARSREEALRILVEKRARTREERYRQSVGIIEDSVLPERSDIPSVRIASPAVGRLMDATFGVLESFETLEGLVMREETGLDAFVLPRLPEAVSGFGVIRTHAGPLLEMLHSREQAAAFLKRHEALIDPRDLEEADEEFGMSPLVGQSTRAPEAFGGSAAALIGAYYRLIRVMSRKARHVRL